MMKKQKKWIALLVAFAFTWLLPLSAMPVSADSSVEQIGSAGAEQTPGFLEQEMAASYQAKKKNIAPVLLIGAGVVVVAAVLLLVVLKTNYDIVGEWRYSWKWGGASDWAETNQKLVFSGDKKSGTLVIWGYPGTYTVDGKNVSFRFNYLETGSDDYTVNTGTFVSKDKISGTWKAEWSGSTGVFEAVRASGAAAAETGLAQKRRDASGRVAIK